MSVPDLTANVARATEITVTGRDAAGEEVQIHTMGFEARALQHEIDHLNGILFIDHISRLKRDILVKKVLKARKDRAGAAIL